MERLLDSEEKALRTEVSVFTWTVQKSLDFRKERMVALNLCHVDLKWQGLLCGTVTDTLEVYDLWVPYTTRRHRPLWQRLV